MNRSPSWGARLKACSLVVFLFGVASLLTALFFATDGKAIAQGTIDKNGGMLGPFPVEKPGQVLTLYVSQPFRTDNVWSFVTGEVLDAEQEYLFSFGEELWRETGYDEGFWRETKGDFELQVTIPQPGVYHLAFQTERSGPQVGGDLKVRVVTRGGSAVPHFAAGLVALLLAVTLRIVAERDNFKTSVS